jgi:hypothetical protein
MNRIVVRIVVGLIAVEGYSEEWLDSCCGHPQGTGIYHDHKYPTGAKSPSVDDGKGHSPIVGFACDGFPIHGPWEADGLRAMDAAICWFGSLALGTAPTGPPNVLFFLTDDESWLERSAYGWSQLPNPAFDRVAKVGVLFTNAFTTAPSCAPSRASVLTGRWCASSSDPACRRSLSVTW